MKNEFDGILKAIDLSKKEFQNEVVIVFQKDSGDYDACLESCYTGDDDKIFDRFLNGNHVPA